MIKRENMERIIRIRSHFKIDRRKGNCTLPNGEKLTDHVFNLLDQQMRLDSLAIDQHGDFRFSTRNGMDYEVGVFNSIEHVAFAEMESRINNFVREVVG